MSVSQRRETRSSSQTSRPIPLSEMYDWPWELDIELFADIRQKICFMSGKERDYFPENPGFSRHAVEYSMNCHSGDVPSPSYVPSENRLQKPISLKGYGIGGLSASRFPRSKIDHFEKKEHKRDSQPTEAEAKDQQASKLTSDGQSISPDVLVSKQRHKKVKLMEYKAVPAQTLEQCKQKKMAFGSSIEAPRFAKEKVSDVVGVGHYDVSMPKVCKKVPFSTFFGKGPVTIHDTIPTVCNFEGFDQCIECLRNLTTTDFYRSLKPIAIPQDYFSTFSSHSEYIQPDIKPHSSPMTRLGKSMVALSISKVAQTPDKVKMCPPQHISLCRDCHHDIIRTGHEYWSLERLIAGKFVKMRHCVNIHEHNNLPSFVNKVPCKLIQRLKRKEALMNKFFSDSG